MEQLLREIEDLKRKVATLESFVQEKNRQQLTFPLDTVTNDVIKDKKLIFEREATGTITADKTLVVSINGKLFKINVL
jgi:hypothetical protein